MTKPLNEIMTLDSVEPIVPGSKNMKACGLVLDLRSVNTGSHFIHDGIVYTVTICDIVHRGTSTKSDDSGAVMARNYSYVKLTLVPVGDAVTYHMDEGERRQLIAEVLQTFAKRLEFANVSFSSEVNALAEEIDHQLSSKGYYNGKRT